MNAFEILITTDIVLVLVALAYVARATGITGQQKRMQFLLVVFLPIAGPLIAIAVHLTDRRKKNEMSDRTIGQSIHESPYPWYIP